MAHITGYDIYLNKLAVYLSNGETQNVYFNQDSGKVYYRNKIGSPTRIKHTGVYIGTDNRGIGWWIHNHYHVGKAHLVTDHEFKQGQSIYLYKEYCTNPWDTVIDKAMQYVLRGERYLPLTSNCQTLVNDSCNNQKKSEDVERFASGALVGLGLLAIIALLAGND